MAACLTQPDHGPVQVLNGGHIGPDDLLCTPDFLLQSVPVIFDGQSKPDSDGSAEDRQDNCSVEGDQQLLSQVKLPERSLEEV